MMYLKGSVHLWIKPGVIVYYGREFLEAGKHRHNALQVVFPHPDYSSHCFSEYGNYSGAVIIDSQVEHDLSMISGWIILIEPHSNLGNSLKRFLDGDKIRLNPYVSKFNYQEITENMNLRHMFSPSLKALNESVGKDNSIPKIDPRISQLLRMFDGCVTGNCIIPDQWKASAAANSIGLSESRFLHLFKGSVGIAWRPYLRWRRLICAVTYLASGHDATYSAVAAGFSDSAHFSRTFKEMFGLTLRQLKASKKFPPGVEQNKTS